MKFIDTIREAENAALERAAAICDADVRIVGNPDRQIAMAQAAAAILALKRQARSSKDRASDF